MLAKTFSIGGRDTRLQFLGFVAALACAMAISAILFESQTFPISPERLAVESIPILLIVVLGSIALSLSAGRRFRDMGRSPWLALLLFIPVVSTFVVIVLLAVKGSNPSVAR